ncbi:ribonuclease H-like domain-containing protein [Tanacetum coccineum]
MRMEVFEKTNALILISLIGNIVTNSCVTSSWRKIVSLTFSEAGVLHVNWTKAEHRGVANAVAETCWLYNLLRKLHTPLYFATLVYYDNVSAVYLSCNPVQHQRTKHIKIDIHFIRDLVALGHVRVLHVLSRYQFADIFTKGLSSVCLRLYLRSFCTSLSVRVLPL